MGGRSEPSSRLRAFEVAEVLKARYGITSAFPPFEFAAKPKTIVLQKKCDSLALALASRLKNDGCRVVYDLCDPIWMQPELKSLRGWDVDRAIELAHLVVVPSKTLREALLERYPNTSCAVIEDAVNLADFDHISPIRSSNQLLRIGFIGTALNMVHLAEVAPALEYLSKKMRLVLRVISAAGMDMPKMPVETDFVEWRLDSFARDLAECDIAVLPMRINNWNCCKSPNRLQLCFALGIPTIFSPIPSWLELTESYKSLQCCAISADDWKLEFETLLDPSIRRDMGKLSRSLVALKHTFEIRYTAPR